MKTFDARVFLKQRRVPLRNFWTLWDKIVSTENSDISSLWEKFFDNRIFLKNWKVPPRKNPHCETKKISTENGDIPFICINFFHTRIFLKLWRVPPRKFSALWVYKIIQQKLMISPSWAEKSFDTRIFLTQWMVPPGNFPALWDERNFNTNKWYPFLMHKVCRYPSMSETLNNYSKKLFGILRLWKGSTEGSGIHFLCMKIFKTWSFLEHWRVSNKNLRYCESKKLTEKRDNPHLSSIVCCPHQRTSGTQN